MDDLGIRRRLFSRTNSTLKPNTDNGLQGQATEHQLPAAGPDAQLPFLHTNNHNPQKTDLV